MFIYFTIFCSCLCFVTLQSHKGKAFVDIFLSAWFSALFVCPLSLPRALVFDDVCFSHVSRGTAPQCHPIERFAQIAELFELCSTLEKHQKSHTHQTHTHTRTDTSLVGVYCKRSIYMSLCCYYYYYFLVGNREKSQNNTFFSFIFLFVEFQHPAPNAIVFPPKRHNF